MDYLNDVLDTAQGLVKGHMVTLRNFFSPAITLHYPEERPELPVGFRGVPALKVNQEGQLNCTACGLCARACPPDIIEVQQDVIDGKRQRYAKVFNLDMSRCMQCNLCIEACPFDALEMTDAFELAAYDIEDTVYDMERLAEMWKNHNAVRIAEGQKMPTSLEEAYNGDG